MSDCKKCGKKVYAMEMVKAMGSSFHKACLKCKKCSKLLSGGNFNDNGKDVYCDRCYMTEFVDEETQGIVSSMENNYNKKQAFSGAKALPGIGAKQTPVTFKPEGTHQSSNFTTSSPAPSGPPKRMNVALQQGIIKAAATSPATSLSSAPKISPSPVATQKTTISSTSTSSSVFSAPKIPPKPLSGTSSASAKFCSGCGKPRNGAFCSSCGKKF